MSQDKQKSIAAMRTFARDRDREHAPVTLEPPVDVAKKVSAAERHAHTAAAPVAVKPVPKASHPDTIPAFHELQKEVAKVVTPTIKAPTVPEKKVKTKLPKNKTVGGGTIITDTKIERTPFFSRLAAALKTWYAQTKKELAPKPKRTYAVTSAERRRGVVQKATSKSGAIFSADKDELQALIRQRQRERDTAPTSDGLDIDWSPFTEPGFLLLDGEHEKILATATTMVPPPKPAPVIMPAPVVKPVAAPLPPTIQFEPPAPPPPREPVVTVAPQPAIIPATLPTPTPMPVPAAAPSTPTPTPTPTPNVVTTVEDELPSEADAATQAVGYWSLPHLTNLTTNEMSVVVVGALLIITAGGFFAFTTMTTTPPPITPITIATPAAVTTKTLRPLLYSANESSITLITEAVPAERGIEVVVTTEEGLIDSSFLPAVAGDDATALLRAMRDARLYVTETGERVLLVTVADPINARGGLLDWERTLYRDLASLLGYTILPVPAVYRDATISDIDTRQLRNADTSILIYGFVKDDLIIVAPSILAFTETLSVIAP